MNKLLYFSVFVILLSSCVSSKNTEMNFYDFKANSITGEEIAMKSFEGKTILVVNTASKCGFTPQFAGLESLYEKYKDQGLVILGFPSNQFGKQDPGTNDEILEFCQMNYGVTFPMFSKIEVNGKLAHPIYKYLKTELPGTLGRKIKWNFTKFLISKEGKPLKRYGPTVKPENLEEAIINAL